MTKQSEIVSDSKYIAVHDHGFVGLVDIMGSDEAIVRAARVSYGKGTKKVNEDRGLIRYLLAHEHTTPFEMVEVVVHAKCPIFVMRQWIRHRTASVNEYSGRYSIMTDEFYLPDNDHIAEQSTTNKQGSEDLGSITDEDRDGVRWLMQAASETNYEIYEALLGSRKEHVPYDPFNSLNGKDPIIDPNFKGIAKETARMVLTLNNYTEFYWKTNLKNLMNFLRLRTDYHAQSEIQNYANAMETLVKNTNRLDFAFEAFDDYIRYAKKLSRMEYELMKDLIAELIDNELLSSSINSRAGKYGLSARETLALVNKFKL